MIDNLMDKGYFVIEINEVQKYSENSSLSSRIKNIFANQQPEEVHIKVRIWGRCWKGLVLQDYAPWLEISSSWKPRKKKGAKPHFLKSGFEDATPQSEIKEIIRNGYKL